MNKNLFPRERENPVVVVVVVVVFVVVNVVFVLVVDDVVVIHRRFYSLFLLLNVTPLLVEATTMDIGHFQPFLPFLPGLRRPCAPIPLLEDPLA